jgi:hypothetical protein
VRQEDPVSPRALVLVVACAAALPGRVSAEDPPSPGRWKVSIVGADGKPIASARARIRWEELRGRDHQAGVPVDDGVLWIKAMEPGRRVAAVRVFAAEDSSGSPLDLAPVTVRWPFSRSDEIVIRMEEPGLVTEGTVLGPEGKGVPGVRVTAYDFRTGEEDKPSQGGRSETDAQGKFRIVGLGDGPYLLSVGAPNTFAWHHDVSARGGERDIEIRLERGVTPTVTVLDDGGKPVVGAYVRADPVRGPSPFDATTGEDGRARLDGTYGMLPNVRARLVVEPPEELRGKLEPFRSEDWMPRDETVRLRPAPSR